MKKNLKNIFNDLSSSPQYLFASVFYSLIIIVSKVKSATFVLHDFKGRSISVATADNYDVTARVNLYFHCLILFIILILIFSLLQVFIKKKILESEINVLKYTSLIGIIFIALQVLNLKIDETLNLIFCVHIILLIKIIFRNSLKLSDNSNKVKDYELMAFAITISFSLFFLYKEFVFILKLQHVLNLFNFLIISGSLIICTTYFLLNKLKDRKNLMLLILKICAPLILIPLISVISNEVYFTLNNKGIFFIKNAYIYLTLISFLFFTVLLKFRKNKKNVDFKFASISKILGNYYFPFFILSLIAFFNYTNFIDTPHDMFELANKSLAVQQFYEFGKIPFINSFNSHTLSEIFFPFIYTFINGFKGFSFLAYNFVYPVISYLLVYFIIKNLTKNIYIALFFSLFFPFTETLLPSYFNIIILGIWIICRVVKNQTTWNYLLFLFCLLFLIIWRIDIGVGVILAAIVSIVFVLINFKNEIHFKHNYFLKAFLYFSTLIIMIFSIILFYTHGEIIYKIKEVISYINSFQTYGIKELTYNEDSSYFAQYFIFPAIILSLLIYLIVFSKWISFHNNLHRNTFIIFVFLSVFYLMNFQRGLVRHSFVEQWDTALSSYAFFIISGSVYIFFKKNSSLNKFVLFVVLSSLIIFSFKFPKDSIDNNNPYQLIIEKTKNFSNFESSHSKIERVNSDDKYSDSTYVEICKFFQATLKNDETFIDFSNNPMLYFYSHKENPDYFNQSLICNHNEYLQKCFLKNISKYKIPYVVFSKCPEIWFDNVDGISNTIRHYRIAEYIFTHYKPFIILNNYCIWKEKNSSHSEDTTLIKNEFKKDDYSTRFIEMKNLKYIPYIWGKYDETFLSNKILIDTKISETNETINSNCEKRFFFKPIIDKTSGNYLHLKCNSLSSNPVEVIVQYGKDGEKKGSFSFSLVENSSPNNYLIRISSQYNWIANENNWISIYPINNDISIDNISILKGD